MLRSYWATLSDTDLNLSSDCCAARQTLNEDYWFVDLMPHEWGHCLKLYLARAVALLRWRHACDLFQWEWGPTLESSYPKPLFFRCCKWADFQAHAGSKSYPRSLVRSQMDTLRWNGNQLYVLLLHIRILILISAAVYVMSQRLCPRQNKVQISWETTRLAFADMRAAGYPNRTWGEV